MKEDIKNALKALADDKVKIESNLEFDLYVKPVPYRVFVSALADYQGSKDKEKASDLFDATIDASSLCDKDGNQIFDAEEYLDFWDTLPMELGLAITKAKRAINDFNSLDAGAKKK